MAAVERLRTFCGLAADRRDRSGPTPMVPTVSANLRCYDPPRAVKVQLDDGRSVPGLQAAWVRWPDGSWRASVRYVLQHDHGRGTHLASLPADRVRLRAD